MDTKWGPVGLMAAVLALIVGVTAVAIMAHGESPPAESASSSSSSSSSPSSSADTYLEQAWHICDDAGVVEDDGYRLTMSTPGPEESTYLEQSTEDVRCVLSSLLAPAWVVDRFRSTTMYDGPQEETWGSITVWWTYSDTGGFSVSIRDGDDQ